MSLDSSRTLSTFTDLGVKPEIADALTAVGIDQPFPIQEMTIPVALGGADLIGQARTGTGKTLAFAIPVIQHAIAPHQHQYEAIQSPGKPQALIVTPTRELATQVAGDIKVAARQRGLRQLTVYGGVGYDTQLDELETGVDIVIGTPGRLLDLANRKALDLSHIAFLVLDEADEMLDLGFLPDVESLLAKTPSARQTMLFSATMPGAIVALARQHMNQPMNIRAESSEETQMVPATSQFVWQVHSMDKPEIVARILQAKNGGRTIVFCRTKRSAQNVADDLAERGFAAAPLHGDMAQAAREKALRRFRDGTITALVATDVAARGIDVENVTHVINYNCPDDEKTYVHRIGRTGRAGASGIALTFIDWEDVTRWKVINKTLDLPFDDPVETYSTSQHLFSEMNIPEDVTGRIKAAQPKSEHNKSGQGKSSRGKSSQGKSSQATSGSRANPRHQGDPQARSQESSGSDAGASGNSSRRRRRRRTRSGKPTEQSGRTQSS